jgi:class 3 adenylate cyclase/tetratricopeptide (TPR) repeat protein
VTTCPSCGAENREGARFCDTCGAALGAAAPVREERKVVSVLFTDLVGFTSRAEQLDPEDVRATLSPYYARLRSEIERHGGTVEKFIGDAVMAVFGAPVAHEDDPERAVRAALAIRDAIRELNESEPTFELQLRSAVTTGEALISLGARPDEGEGMASGDVVNTAARLQAAAPVDGILVGEATYRATSNAIEYRAADPVEAKGKAEPVKVWEAVSAKSRFGLDVEQHLRSELVGRERELSLLVDALAACRSELSPQLITLVGVPGIGKSRLVAELFQVVDRDPELIWWRQGRSLPYGEGLSYWALGEIAKAQAGILETDDEATAEAKLHTMVEEVLADSGEDEWVEGHLRPLVGLGSTLDSGSDRRSEAFSAWRRLLEALAEHRPLVLVFEDLHWSDEGLLDFVDYLADWASGVPLLVVCTARPELLDRRPGWGGGKRNAATVSISPLSEKETGQLLGSLLDQTLLPAEIQSAVLARAEGNPLYAEEYVRMLQDRGFLVQSGSGWRLSGDEELPLPETVQGMIAARLDALAPAEKELVQDAAVLGKVFWPGALQGIGLREPREAEELLHTLERKEFVRRERRSAVAGETQYAFLHLLVRDVAYGQIPRAARVDKHRLAAEWIESLSTERSEDRAEMLAHHYREALSLATSAGVDVHALRQPASIAFADAAERAWALNSWAAAVDFAKEAIELTDDNAKRPELHLLISRATFLLGGRDLESTTAARDGFQALDELDRAAEAEMLLSELYWLRGDGENAHEHGERAVALVEGLAPSRSKAFVLAQRARNQQIAGFTDEALSLAREALPMAEQLGLDGLTGHLLNTIGMNRVHDGDEGGMADLERSAQLAEATNSVDDIHRAYNNLANMAWHFARLDAADEYLERARQADERYGNVNGLLWLAGEFMIGHDTRGNWDEALALADTFVESAATRPHYHLGPARVIRARVFLGRGDVSGALTESELALSMARSVKDPQFLGPTLATRARVLAAAGDRRTADRLIDEILRDHDIDQGWFFGLPLILAELGRKEELLTAIEQAVTSIPWLEAGRAVATGDLTGAAAMYAKIGAQEQEAMARLLAAEELVAEGRRAEADAQLTPALAYFRRVRAKAYIGRGEALLAASA